MVINRIIPKEEIVQGFEKIKEEETTGLDTMIAAFMKWGCWKFH